MRVPQYVSAAMAICGSRDRLGLCPGQVDALSAQPDRAGRRHSIARDRARGGSATTKLVRDLGLRVRLVDAPFEQPLGYRSAGEVWARQLRWAQLRQASFRQYYALELLAGSLAPLAAAAYVVAALRLPLGSIIAVAAVWYGSEAALARAAGWHLSLRSPAAFILRDILLPLVWIGGGLGRVFVWRGNEMRPAESRGAV